MIVVSIANQDLKVIQGEEIKFAAPVSTAAKGTGFEDGSNQTPTGRFIIRERIGEGAPLFTTFKSRIPLGVWKGEKCEDAILSRILWLDGQDEQNSNTFQRYIYFHGTNAEELIGTPASHGCIRLHNRDMITLFDLSPIGTEVRIS